MSLFAVAVSTIIMLTANTLDSVDFGTAFPDVSVIPDQARAQYVALAGFHYAMAVLPDSVFDEEDHPPLWHEFAAGRFSIQRFPAANDRVHVVVTAEVGEQQNTLWRVVDRGAFTASR